jgi:hypothetical protein
MRQLFDWAARGLPRTSAATVSRASPPPQRNHGDALAPQARRVIRDA